MKKVLLAVGFALSLAAAATLHSHGDIEHAHGGGAAIHHHDAHQGGK